MKARQTTASRRIANRSELESELADLRARLAEAEATLRAIHCDEVDAVVVVSRERGAEQVLTIGGAHIPWRHFVEEMRDGALTVAEDGTILHANQRLAQISGRDHVVGQSLATLFDPSDALHVCLQNVGQTPMASECVLMRSDGSRLPVELSLSVLPLEGPRRIGIVVRVAAEDVGRVSYTALAEGAKGLLARELETVLSQLPVGVVSVDARTGMVTYANRQAEEILGRSLIGLERQVSHVELTSWRADGTVVEPEHLPTARVLRGEGVVREELTRVRDDGAIVQTRVSAMPVHDDAGRVTSVVLTFEDISSEAATRAEREANDRFRELFIGILGHDLRDPLTTVVTGSALLRRRLAGADERRILERVDASAERMMRMIEQMLDFAGARLGGGIPIRRAPVDLHALVRTAVTDLTASHPDRAIEVHLEGTGSGEWDADRLMQVLSNLLGNAIKHGDTQRPIHVRARSEDSKVVLDVHNDGPPIPPALLPVIFDPFRRGSPSLQRRTRGVGLGLYIAQEIIHAHSGTLSVVSSAAEGTTFTAVLPRSLSGPALNPDYRTRVRK